VRILVVNAGSSSVKLSLLDDHDDTVAERELDAPSARLDIGELRTALNAGLGDADLVAHRIVHGGERFSGPVPVTDEVKSELRALTGLAPLHQPKSLAALDAVSAVLPDLPAVACFDTAFHATLPRAAATYALPAAWRARWHLRRYGFHGLSHGWVAFRAPQLVERPAGELRIVSAHLGAGASLCAIQGGTSVDTTMGFTPLEGLVMATRSGSVDPGLLLWLLHQEEISEPELADALEHESGLKGLAGSADMRDIVDRADAGDPAAALALEVYLHRLRGGIAAMVAALGGLDVLVFTGGVGEHAATVRARAASGLGFLGVAIGDQLNHAVRGDGDIGAPDAAVRTLVVHAREDLEIARQTRRLIESTGAGPA
jgi:acetate kinase